MNSKVDGVPFTVLTYSTGGSKNYQYENTSEGRIQRKDPTSYNTSSYEYHQQAGILNDESTHGGVDVPVFATGTTGINPQKLTSPLKNNLPLFVNRSDVSLVPRRSRAKLRRARHCLRGKAGKIQESKRGA